MKAEDIDFLKTLIIKLDITIEAERNNVSADGLMLIFDFTEKNRKESITKALDILNRTQNKWQKLKEWINENKYKQLDDCNIGMLVEGYSDEFVDVVNVKDLLDKMQELEGEDENTRK